jgi:hypothetical protein
LSGGASVMESSVAQNWKCNHYGPGVGSGVSEAGGLLGC